MKKVLFFIAITIICAFCLNVNAASRGWEAFYENAFSIDNITRMKCTYDVTGINGLNSIEFVIDSSGMSVKQNSYFGKLTQYFDSGQLEYDTEYHWEAIKVNFAENKSITYSGNRDDIPFDITEYARNVGSYHVCQPLYIWYHEGTDDYSMHLTGPSQGYKSKGYKSIEITANPNKCEIIAHSDTEGEIDLYDSYSEDDEEEDDWDAIENSITDDTREKKTISLDKTFVEFNNTYSYGDIKYGIIKKCTIYESPLNSTLTKYGLTDIELNGEKIEACLYRQELNLTTNYEGQESVWSEYVKSQYLNHQALVYCGGTYSPKMLKEVIPIKEEEKDKRYLYYGVVCLKSYATDIEIQEIIEKMRAARRQIDDYSYDCDKKKSKEAIEKSLQLVDEYKTLKLLQSGTYTNAEGDKLAKDLEGSEVKCINNNTSSKRSGSMFSPLTGALTCNTLFGAPGSTVRTLISNILKFIKYGGPILMLLLTIVDLVSTVTSGEDKDFKKVFNNFIKRFIAAALLFFINDIIKLLFLIVGLEYNCIIE